MQISSQSANLESKFKASRSSIIIIITIIIIIIIITGLLLEVKRGYFRNR